MTINAKASQQNSEPIVYFSAYIPANKGVSDFGALKKQSNTAEHVRNIDPYAEFVFLMSNGIFSYSFLDNENLLQIKYNSNEGYEDYDDLIIESIIVIPRQNSSSCYSSILSKDLP